LPFFIERPLSKMFKLALWEAILLAIITKVLQSSNTRYCEEHDMEVCDYSKTDFYCILLILGYIFGKILLEF
jgi:hypothetical protein